MTIEEEVDRAGPMIDRALDEYIKKRAHAMKEEGCDLDVIIPVLAEAYRAMEVEKPKLLARIEGILRRGGRELH
ncbi:hypothetical protein [Hansschlegelia sp. KR7-227]|uniref:hypothetical protein n=1 Tax=Hansschlegelia sp. KR7-227 TaxID=3400914 RepID=UPI003C006B80